MQPFITPKGFRLIVRVTLVGIFAVVLSISPWIRVKGSQQLNIEAAKKHAAFIEPRIHADPRFAGVGFGWCTGNGGCMSVGGFEALSESDLQDLKRMLEESKPPVPVIYMKMLPADAP